MERIKSGVLISLLCLLVIPVACCRFVTNDYLIQRHLRVGHEALARGDYTKAENEFKSAVELSEQSANDQSSFITATGDLARLYSTEKRDAEAERLFRERISKAERLWSKDSRLPFVYDDLAI